LSFWIVLGVRHQHANSRHWLGLLRARRKRPRHNGAAEKRNEMPSFKLVELHWIP
jgi:hypothetical protein